MEEEVEGRGRTERRRRERREGRIVGVIERVCAYVTRGGGAPGSEARERGAAPVSVGMWQVRPSRERGEKRVTPWILRL